MNKTIMQVCIDRQRYLLEEMLEKDLITEKDIIFLMNQDDNFGIIFSDKKYSKKELYLKKIFRQPFLLCDQNVSDNIKKLLPIFLDRMYNLELNEWKYKLDNQECTKEEFDDMSSILYFQMYESSKDGICIKNTGHAYGIKEDILVLKA